MAPGVAAWRHGGTALVDAFPIPDGSSPAGRDLVDAVAHGRPRAGTGRARSAASRPQNEDFIDAVYGNFPLMIALIAVITFILLARAFRSLLLPLKAVILNVISVGAAWGVLSWSGRRATAPT